MYRPTGRLFCLHIEAVVEFLSSGTKVPIMKFVAFLHEV
jgi:hypothetical protein